MASKLDALLVTDNISSMAATIKAIEKRATIKALNIYDLPKRNFPTAHVIVVDVNLSREENVGLVSEILRIQPGETKRIFIVDKKKRRSETIHANSLGAHVALDRPADHDDLIGNILALRPRSKPNRRPEKGSADEACIAISDITESLLDSVRRGRAIEAEPVNDCSDLIINSIRQNSVDTLLASVRQHHSFTFRHSMIVTIFATSFASRYGMKARDIRRLTTGALLHDIGKAVVPQTILDKPGRLSPGELQMIRRHPLDGAGILEKSGEFSAEIVDIALSHHELLDGSGYPHGLQGSEIKDIVRIMTVVDIYSALVEARPYKKSFTLEDAYEVLLNMGAKLDREIVRAFKPVALEKEGDELLTKLIQSKVAA